MTLSLRCGETVVRRDDHHLQIGIDGPRLVVVPDTAAVRRAAYDLEVGRGLSDRDLAHPAVASLVHKLDSARLLATDPAPLRARVSGPAALEAELRDLAPIHEFGAEMQVLLSSGPLLRERVDDLIREGTPHLILEGGPDGWVVGPYVVPGVTACLRCVDATRGERDPRRALVVEQYARRTHGNEDAVGRMLALTYLIRELRMLARGERPTTWSAIVEIGDDGTLEPRHARRHPACGCAWDIALAT